MAKASKTPAKRQATRPEDGFPGAPPEQSEWFATNYLALRDGVLYQLHKGRSNPDDPKSETVWHWLPVPEI